MNETKRLRNTCNKINKRMARLTVLGSGYVGLPTAALFANLGFDVTAVDIQSRIVESINGGISPINEPGLQSLVSCNVQAGKLKASLADETTIEGEDVIIVSVQTPIDENKKPILSFLMDAIEIVGKSLRKEMLIIICSTVSPGTLRRKIVPTLELLSGLKSDIDFYLAYVPERIAPGKALKEFVESPRLVGGIGPKSTKKAAELFKTVCKRIIETDATTAEIAKVAENTFRDVNIAFANQLAFVCEQQGADIRRVIELANTHPRVNIHEAGPGVGGPCLTKDPYLLVQGTESNNKNLILAAREINDYMPHHVVELVLNALGQSGKKVNHSKIAVLGTAYKADVGDARFSPSEPIINNLIELGAETVVYDPHCPSTFGAKKANSLDEATEGADCLVIVTDHIEFRNLDCAKIKKSMKEKPVIVDGKRLIDPDEAQKLGFIYYGVGYRKPKNDR